MKRKRTNYTNYTGSTRKKYLTSWIKHFCVFIKSRFLEGCGIFLAWCFSWRELCDDKKNEVRYENEVKNERGALSRAWTTASKFRFILFRYQIRTEAKKKLLFLNKKYIFKFNKTQTRKIKDFFAKQKLRKKQQQQNNNNKK